MIFETTGKVNTTQTLSLALARAKKDGIKKILVASGTGNTAKELCDMEHDGIQLVCVTCAYGHRGIKEDPIAKPLRDELNAKGMHFITAAHSLSGAERSLSTKFGGVYPMEIAAHTLRMFSAGVKVAVEISLMACDAGEVEPGERIIAIGGTANGSDSAVILRPSYTNDFLNSRIDEIICKPIVHEIKLMEK